MADDRDFTIWIRQHTSSAPQTHLGDSQVPIEISRCELDRELDTEFALDVVAETMTEAFQFDVADITLVVPPALIPTSDAPQTLDAVHSMAWNRSAANNFNKKIIKLLAAAAASKLLTIGITCALSLLEDIATCLFQDVAARWRRQRAQGKRPGESKASESRRMSHGANEKVAEAESNDRVVLVHRLWDVLDAFPASTLFHIV